MKGDRQTIVYAAVLGLVCATLLTLVGRYTAPIIQKNREAEERRNVLKVLGIEFNPRSSHDQLAEVFQQNVRQTEVAGTPAYQYVDADGRPLATALPVQGPGMWDRIRGYVALEPDGRTLRGVRFHDQNETPGLGGEISSDRFLNQFKGLSIIGPDGTTGIRIVKNKTADNEVDGITAASVTCGKVEAMLNETIRRLPRDEVKP